MWPKRPLILDESFNFERIFPQNKIASLSVIDLGNLKGFNLNSKHLYSNRNAIYKGPFWTYICQCWTFIHKAVVFGPY